MPGRSGNTPVSSRHNPDGTEPPPIPPGYSPTVFGRACTLYATHNDDAYTSGTKKPNSGYLRVAVSPDEAKVEYVRCWLPKDETATQKTGDIAHSYTIKAKS